ncbi:MAG TPA: glyoxalase superfamily protein [Tepidisphaeraceae bacterium]|jgi:uncharacterized glyoxalase superfamily protein PhnB|nr:glyoxalase superfamily protein [Tepidisphaeraceae bacterium]
MQRALPVLRIDDASSAKAFYVDWLGFAVDWEFRFGDDFPVYMQVSRGALVLHLSEHKGDASPGGMALIEVDDLDRLWREWQAKRPDMGAKPERAPWNALAMRLRDPFGNTLAFNQTLSDSA